MKVSVTDEMYIPSVLSLLGLINTRRSACEIVKRRVTFCDWSMSARNPETFDHIPTDLFQQAREEGCFFFRKIRLRNSAQSSAKRPRDSSDNCDYQPFYENWLNLVSGDSRLNSDSESDAIAIEEYRAIVDSMRSRPAATAASNSRDEESRKEDPSIHENNLDSDDKDTKRIKNG